MVPYYRTFEPPEDDPPQVLRHEAGRGQGQIYIADWGAMQTHHRH
jgi:hypothetical protein